ncbi:type II secretion system protein [Eggerthellaceae bacterium zg-1084]|uniref:Type II secretion system protein n=1 Tax=Berryella wangjianweii TaxID=2734634 RepID=A0A6M8J1G2_9ACTN|nr:type II secretion system F family protein [Berryella wangjianweii]NPD30727.1 type II secretion system protein [Berryella wangjianweii]QKF07364.1 type II secretion system protein [Berryella wangjianweii]
MAGANAWPLICTLSSAASMGALVGLARGGALVRGIGEGSLLFEGVPALAPLARFVLTTPALESLAQDECRALAQRGHRGSPEGLVSLWCVCSIAAFALPALAMGSPVLGVALCCCVLVGGLAHARTLQERHAWETRESVPGVLESLADALQAGLTVQQALGQVARTERGSLARAFQHAGALLGTGGSLDDALEAIRARSSSPELAFVLVALRVQHRAGGAMGTVIRAAADAARADASLKRSLRAHTAQARLSARIVTVMPFLLMAVFSLASPRFLAPFFGSVGGIGLLSAALCMQAAGVLMVRRVLKAGERA